MKDYTYQEGRRLALAHILYFAGFFIILYLNGWHGAVPFLFVPSFHVFMAFKSILKKCDEITDDE